MEDYVIPRHVTKTLRSCRSNMRRNKSGFSLIELLVVIATVSILAALLAESLARGKRKAQQIQCANNVRQLGIALRGHVAANNTYPQVIQPSWMADLQAELSVAKTHINSSKYLSEGVWKCPSAHRPADLPPSIGYESYAYNGYGMSSPDDTNSLGLGGHHVWSKTQMPGPAVKESEVLNPSQMIAIGDSFMGQSGTIQDGGWLLSRTHASTADAESTKRAYARHQGKASVVFCDGHVEQSTLKFLFADTTDAALAQWNRDNLPHREALAQ